MEYTMPLPKSNERFPILEDPSRLKVAAELANLAIEASQLVDDFSNVERIPRFADGHRENDVEHSFMLAILAPEMADLLELGLSTDKVRRFAIVHDLLEVEVGDVATLDLTEDQLAEKERKEQEALEDLSARLPTLPS